jgi:hypothetical protein
MNLEKKSHHEDDKVRNTNSLNLEIVLIKIYIPTKILSNKNVIGI